MNRYTFPHWVFCPCKPHPFDNEYHTICCAKSGILFDFELEDGKETLENLKKILEQGGKYPVKFKFGNNLVLD